MEHALGVVLAEILVYGISDVDFVEWNHQLYVFEGFPKVKRLIQVHQILPRYGVCSFFLRGLFVYGNFI